MRAKANLKLDFVIAGAPKSGTSFLHNWLLANPALSIPDREIVTFLPEFYSHQAVTALGNELDPAKIVGVKRPDYLFNFNAMHNLRETCGDVKIIAVLRDPVVRCISHFYHLRRYAFTPFVSFETFVETVLDGALPSFGVRGPQIEQHSFYEAAVQNARRLFGDGALHIINFEDLSRATKPTTAAVSRFIGVEPVEAPPMREIPQQVIYNDEWQKLWAAACREEGFCNEDGVVIGYRKRPLSKAREKRAEDYRHRAAQFREAEKPRFPRALLDALHAYFAPEYEFLAREGLTFAEFDRMRSNARESHTPAL